MDLMIEELDAQEAPLSFWEGVGIVGGAFVVGVGIGAAIT